MIGRTACLAFLAVLLTGCASGADCLLPSNPEQRDSCAAQKARADEEDAVARRGGQEPGPPSRDERRFIEKVYGPLEDKGGPRAEFPPPETDEDFPSDADWD